MNPAPEIDHLADHLFGAFKHHEFLPRRQTDYRIRGRLDVLDQIGIQNQRNVVDASEMNHRARKRLQGAYRPRSAKIEGPLASVRGMKFCCG